MADAWIDLEKEVLAASLVHKVVWERYMIDTWYIIPSKRNDRLQVVKHHMYILHIHADKASQCGDRKRTLNRYNSADNRLVTADYVVVVTVFRYKIPKYDGVEVIKIRAGCVILSKGMK
jgi:hypothetical protein